MKLVSCIVLSILVASIALSFFRSKMYMSFILTSFMLIFMIYLIILTFVNIKYIPFWLCDKKICKSKLLSMHHGYNGELKVFMEDIKSFKVYTMVTFFNIISFVISSLIYLMNHLLKNTGEKLNDDVIVSCYLVITMSILIYFYTKKSVKNFRIEYYETFDDEFNIRGESVKGDDLTPTNPNKSVNGNMIDD